MNLKNILKPLSSISENLAEFLFPPRCVICDKIYPKDSFKSKIYICDDCHKKVHFVRNFSSNCKKCSRPIDSDSIICSVCQVTKRHFDASFSCLIYEKDVRQSLLLYKFGESQHKYRTFAEIMLAEMNNISPFPKIDIICPVPLSKKRKRKRGFDHMASIAKYISSKTGLPLSLKAIKKLKDIPPQSKLSFKERQLSVGGAFKVTRPTDVSGKSVLLIDDIYTPGATTSEISKILKRAGAKSVFVLTLCITHKIDTGDDFKI